MASFTDLLTDVHVGETEVGEVYIGEVDVGTISREVDVEIEPHMFVEACDDEEKIQLLDMLYSDNDIFTDWIARMTENGTETFLETVVDTIENRGLNFKDYLPNTVQFEQTEEERQQIRTETEEALEGVLQKPPLEVIRFVKFFQEVDPEQLKAFPRNVITAICEKLIGASDPLVVYQTPPDLKMMIQSMEPGEVTEDFLQELKLQTG